VPGRWSWTDAIIFIAVISALQLTMFWMLTRVFFGMITEGDQCPVCNGTTHAVERQGVWRLFGSRQRRSWCTECGWEGLLRRSDAWRARHRERERAWRQARASMANRRNQSGQLPLNSKKSS
jgi:hypothetical protein